MVKQLILGWYQTSELFEELKNRKVKELRRSPENRMVREEQILREAERSIQSELSDDKQQQLFKETMDAVLSRCDGYEGDERIVMLRSFRKLISKDLMYSYLSSIAYENKGRWMTLPNMPTWYKNNNGEEVNLERTIIDGVNIKELCLIDDPYQTNKWNYHLMRKNELDPQEMKKEGIAYYYPTFDIVLIGAGNCHRTAEAMLNRKDCIIPVRKYDDSLLLENVKTDGAYWLSMHDNSIIDKCTDFRLAVIYEIKRMEQGTEEEAE